MSCPASANLDLAIPNWVEPVRVTTPNAANTGTQHHLMFEQLFQMSAKDLRCYAEMLAYVADLRSTRRFKVLTEAQITATWLQGNPGTTADLVLYTQDELHILDPKTGKIPVEVVDNEQLLFYAACFAPLAPKAKGVTVHILQPWAETGCRSWYVDTLTLKKFMDDAIEAERKILAKDLTFHPSDKCMFCPANPHSRGAKGHPLCPAMMSVLYPASQPNELEILSL
jgi:hypothetical protein